MLMERGVIVLIVFLLIFPLVSAVQINMNTNFSQGETLTAQVYGNFINPLQQQNILLYKGHVRVPFIPYVNRINETYYIYGQLFGKPPGDYSLVLTNIRYFESGKTQTQDVLKNFTIANSTADFSIDPAFVNTNKDFFITAQNIVGSIVTIDYFLSNFSSMIGSEGSIQISPGESKSIHFSIEGINRSMLSAVLKTLNTSYEVPIFLFQGVNNLESASIFVQPLEMYILMSTSSGTTRYIYVSNPGKSPENISLNISDSLQHYIYLSNRSFVLGPNSTKKIEVSIVSGDDENFTEGIIDVVSGNLVSPVHILLNFSKDYIPANLTSASSLSLFKTCAQLGGTICNDSKMCNGETKNTEDGICCLGTCQVKKASNTKKIIGWSLVVIILISLVLFSFNRYKKTKRRPVNLLNFIKKK